MLSIVIPVYNVEDYIDECVCSVVSVKEDIEILLIDDGSTDSSGLKCDLWKEKDRRIIVIHQENGGLSSARNTGMQNAHGDYVMFLDSDDFIDPDMTNKLIDLLEYDSDIYVGLYENYYTDEDLYEKEICDAFLSLKKNSTISDFLRTIPKDGKSCHLIACRFVVKRQLLLENSLLFVQGIYHEDEEWVLRLLTTANSVYVTDLYYYKYRQARKGSIMSSIRPKNIWDRLIIMDHACSLLSKNGNDQIKIEFIKTRIALLYLSNIHDCYVLDKREKKLFFNEMKKYSEICSPYLLGKVGKSVQICQYVLGIRGMSYLFNFARLVLKH